VPLFFEKVTAQPGVKERDFLLFLGCYATKK